MMEMSDSIAALSAALADAQAEIGGAIRRKENAAFKAGNRVSKYADLASVWDAWQEVGPEQGLAVVQFPGAFANGMATVTTILSHKSGEWMRETLTMPMNKHDAQGYGSALTYARRYALAAIAGIAPEDDDAEGSGKMTFPEGPHTSKSAVLKDWRAFAFAISKVNDSDTLEGMIADAQPMLAQFRRMAKMGIATEHYEGGDDAEGVAQTLTDARARVAARAEMPADADPVPLEAEHVWSETTVRLVEQAQACSSTNGLNAWKREAKQLLDTLDAIEAAYVRGAVNDKAAALKAAEITAAG